MEAGFSLIYRKRLLRSGDALVLEDGALVLVEAANEALYEITASSSKALSELAWHIGNRHLPAEIALKRILILRDHVIKTMLEGLGAQFTEILAPFNPLSGAYSSQVGDHGHHPVHDHSDITATAMSMSDHANACQFVEGGEL